MCPNFHVSLSINVSRPWCFVVVSIVYNFIDFRQSKKSEIKLSKFPLFFDVQWNNLPSVDAFLLETLLKALHIDFLSFVFFLPFSSISVIFGLLSNDVSQLLTG